MKKIQKEALMKEAGIKVPTTSHSPQESDLNNPIPATESEIAEQAMNETNAGGGDADEHVDTLNKDSPETSVAGDVAIDAPSGATKGFVFSVRRLFGF